MTDEIRVYRKHLRQIDYCGKGSRRLADQLGISWQQLLREGIPLSKLEGVDDVMVKKLVEHVRKENGR